MRVGRHGKEKPRAALASMRDTGTSAWRSVSSYTLYFLCFVSLAAGLTVQMPRAGSTGQFGDTECQHSH